MKSLAIVNLRAKHIDMFRDISGMRDNEKKIDEILKKDKTSAKRTTIILEKEEREFIDSLIREGKEPGNLSFPKCLMFTEA
ncbi:MAG: hypothetical protein QXH37_03090 [Candidatus Bathyarchaeia archaeon]